MILNSKEGILNIKKISLIFFIVIGFLHLGSGAFVANDLFPQEAKVIIKLLDIPFILTALIYGSASLRLGIVNPDESNKKLDIFLVSVIIIVLLAVLGIKLFAPPLSIN